MPRPLAATCPASGTGAGSPTTDATPIATQGAPGSGGGTAVPVVHRSELSPAGHEHRRPDARDGSRPGWPDRTGCRESSGTSHRRDSPGRQDRHRHTGPGHHGSGARHRHDDPSGDDYGRHAGSARRPEGAWRWQDPGRGPWQGRDGTARRPAAARRRSWQPVRPRPAGPALATAGQERRINRGRRGHRARGIGTGRGADPVGWRRRRRPRCAGFSPAARRASSAGRRREWRCRGRRKRRRRRSAWRRHRVPARAAHPGPALAGAPAGREACLACLPAGGTTSLSPFLPTGSCP